jgi:hypothetical protein
MGLAGRKVTWDIPRFEDDEVAINSHAKVGVPVVRGLLGLEAINVSWSLSYIGKRILTGMNLPLYRRL